MQKQKIDVLALYLTLMKYIMSKYSGLRENVLARNSCQRFFKFVTLPELKFLKTLGFIATILF